MWLNTRLLFPSFNFVHIDMSLTCISEFSPSLAWSWLLFQSSPQVWNELEIYFKFSPSLAWAWLLFQSSSQVWHALKLTSISELSPSKTAPAQATDLLGDLNDLMSGPSQTSFSPTQTQSQPSIDTSSSQQVGQMFMIIDHSISNTRYISLRLTWQSLKRLAPEIYCNDIFFKVIFLLT